MVGVEVVTEKVVELNLYTYKMEKRFDSLSAYLAVIIVPMLLIIAIQIVAF